MSMEGCKKWENELGVAAKSMCRQSRHLPGSCSCDCHGYLKKAGGREWATRWWHGPYLVTADGRQASHTTGDGAA